MDVIFFVKTNLCPELKLIVTSTCLQLKALEPKTGRPNEADKC